MKRIYVAGPYSADNVLGVLDNIRNGLHVSTRLFVAGYAPFCPWSDFLFHLMTKPSDTIRKSRYYEYSMAFLECCHAVLVLPGYENSAGTLAEIQRAGELNIPVYYDYYTLKRAVKP
jgi:hypothetical protein